MLLDTISLIIVVVVAFSLLTDFLLSSNVNIIALLQSLFSGTIISLFIIRLSSFKKNNIS